MKTEVNSVVIGERTYKFPDTMQALGHDNLHVVPLDLIQPADKEDLSQQGYHWVNPRHYEGSVAGQTPKGFEKENMDSLLCDIRDDGLIYPIVARWIVVDGELCIEILDGERRWRCIRQLVATDQMCFDKGTNQKVSASKLYQSIPCKVYHVSDKESFKIAYMATHGAVKWGDGANVRAIKHLRSAGCSDEEILDLTKKSGQWLREEDKLCRLDDHTFGCYSQARINRAVALRLAGVVNLKSRHELLEDTMNEALEADSKRLAKLDEDISKLEDQEEIAEAKVAEAEMDGDNEKIAEAQAELEEVQQETKVKRRQRARGAQGKTKHMRRVVSKNLSGGDELPESVIQPLRPGKIKRQLEQLEELLENDGKDGEGNEIMSATSLQYVIAAYQAILNGEENIEKVMKRQKKIIDQKREKILKDRHQARQAAK